MPAPAKTQPGKPAIAAKMPAPPPAASNYNIPAMIAAARGGVDKGSWILFGSTAAFLGVIWAAIWLAVGR